jgi:glutaredoxin 2
MMTESISIVRHIEKVLIKGCASDITDVTKTKVTEWIASQTLYLQSLLRDIQWES